MAKTEILERNQFLVPAAARLIRAYDRYGMIKNVPASEYARLCVCYDNLKRKGVIVSSSQNMFCTEDIDVLRRAVAQITVGIKLENVQRKKIALTK